MFGFLAKIGSGIAYGIGVGIGITIWNILKKLFKIVLFGGGAAIGLHQFGYSLNGLLPQIHQFIAPGSVLSNALTHLM